MPFDSTPEITTTVPAGLDPLGKILWEAADLIERRGWTTGRMRRGVGGPVCVLGALFLARRREEPPEDTADGLVTEADYDLFDEAAEKLGFGNGTAIFCWNDAPGRTAPEVIARLRTAALVEHPEAR